MLVLVWPNVHWRSQQPQEENRILQSPFQMNPPALGIFLEDRPPVAVIMPAVEVRTSLS